MSIIWALEAREFEGDDNGAEVSSERAFYVGVDSRAHDDQWMKFHAPGFTFPNPLGGTTTIPNYLTLHPSNPWALAKKLSAKIYKGLIWNLDFKYDNKPLTDSEQQKIEVADPVDLSVRRRRITVMKTIPAIRDRDGKPILNSARDDFDPPLTVDIECPGWHFTKNYVSEPSWLNGVMNTVNNGSITIGPFTIPAGKAAFKNPTVSEPNLQGSISYVTVEWDIVVDLFGWQPRPLDQGLNKLVRGVKSRITEKDLDNTKPATVYGRPMLLDGNGGVRLNPTLDNAVFLDVNYYPEIAYGAIPGINGTL